jgi:hypothetical protein
MRTACTFILGLYFGVFITVYGFTKPRYVPESRLDPARVWSKKCLEQGKTYVAMQADGGKWKVHCT